MKKFEYKYSVSLTSETDLFDTFSQARSQAFRMAKAQKFLVTVWKMAFYNGAFIEGSDIVVLTINGEELY